MTFFPVYFLIQAGIFTVPISLHCRWWVHPSDMRIRSPSCSWFTAFTPLAAASRNPLYLAIKTEKEVSSTWSGTTSATSENAWLSVITRSGSRPSFLSAAKSSVSRTTTDMAPASRISRMACCCGRISRPFGAALSMGTTRTTRSRGFKKSPTRRQPFSFSFTRPAILSFSSWIW